MDDFLLFLETLLTFDNDLDFFKEEFFFFESFGFYVKLRICFLRFDKLFDDILFVLSIISIWIIFFYVLFGGYTDLLLFLYYWKFGWEPTGTRECELLVGLNMLDWVSGVKTDPVA